MAEYSNKLLKKILLFGCTLYTFSELYCYYKHIVMVRKLNESCNYDLHYDTDKDKHIRVTAMTNIIEHDKDSKKFCEHLFYNKIKFENIPRNLLIHTLGTMLFMKNTFANKEYLEVDNYVTMIEKSHNVNLTNTYYDKNVKYMIFGKTPIFTWYKPLFLIFIMYCAKKIFNRYLYKLGFVRQQFPNGYVVWIRKCIAPKYNPLILFHCSVGGCIPYYKIIKELIVGRTLILSELPGISWENYVSTPPLLVQVAENLHEVVVQNNISNYDLLCHSFGGLLCMKYFYKYHSEIKKIICIESGVILNHVFNVYSQFFEIMSVKNKPMDYIDFICAPITHRDPYIQYYFHRDLHLSDTILLGRPEENNKEIHLILSEDDDKIPTEYYHHYVNSKKLPYNLKIFKKRTHGAFIYDFEFQNYVINILNK